MLHEEDAQRPLCAEEQQQKIAHHRGRQHHGQGEHHVQHALDGAGQLCDIISGKMPRKNTAAQLMSAMRRLFHKGYQSMILTFYIAVKPTPSNTVAARSVCR